LFNTRWNEAVVYREVFRRKNLDEVIGNRPSPFPFEIKIAVVGEIYWRISVRPSFIFYVEFILVVQHILDLYSQFPRISFIPIRRYVFKRHAAIGPRFNTPDRLVKAPVPAMEVIFSIVLGKNVVLFSQLKSAFGDAIGDASHDPTEMSIGSGLDNDVLVAGRRAMAAEVGRMMLVRHSPQITDLRLNRDEMADVGREVGRRLASTKGDAVFLIPKAGYDSYATEGEAFFDPDADAAFVEALRASVPECVAIFERDLDINDPAFATEAAKTLIGLMQAKTKAS
jgi:uncharacterized protein UPF0261